MVRIRTVVLLAFAGFVLLSQLVVAAPPTGGISALSSALSNLCSGVKGLLPIAAMLMLVLAGIIYAAGQMMGAETRARANVWATACLTGAVIGLLIVVIAPSVLQAISPGGVAITC